MPRQTVPSKGKKLASNIMLYTVTMFLPKLFSFFLVPVYTACLTTNEYGISDLVLNTCSLIQPFFSLGINVAVLTFTIENKNDIRPYQIGIKHWYISSIALIVCLVIVSFFLKVNNFYLLFIFLIYSATTLSDVQIAYLKSQEQMKLIGICTVGSSFITIVSNILTIVVFRLGAYGFLISTVTGFVFQIFIVFFYIRKNNLLGKDCLGEKRIIRRDMYKYSTPLIFSSISWWMYSASDRYFIAGMINASENGIYSVAYKIPNMLQILQNIFSHAWLFSVFDLYKTDEGRRYIERIYDLYSFVMCFLCGIFISADTILAKIMYSNEFYAAWKYVPPLLMSIVFTALSTFFNSFLTVYKRSDITAKVAIITAVMNSALNYILIAITGSAMGASIATAVTAAVSWGISLYNGYRLGKIRILMVKQIMIFILLAVESIIMIKWQNIYICVFIALIIMFLNQKNCRTLLKQGIFYIKNINKDLNQYN